MFRVALQRRSVLKGVTLRHICVAIVLLSAAIVSIIVVVPRTYAASYDRSAAVRYADDWAHGRNSNYPNFGSGCGCNDCTNFTSQILEAGGYPLHTGDYDENDLTEWWYRREWYGGFTNSKTWSASDWFNSFVAQYPGDFKVNEVHASELSRGDIIVMDLDGDGIPNHTRAVVGHGYTSTDQRDYTDGCGNNRTIPDRRHTLLVNQHCVDRWHVAWDLRYAGFYGKVECAGRLVVALKGDTICYGR